LRPLLRARAVFTWSSKRSHRSKLGDPAACLSARETLDVCDGWRDRAARLHFLEGAGAAEVTWRTLSSIWSPWNARPLMSRAVLPGGLGSGLDVRDVHFWVQVNVRSVLMIGPGRQAGDVGGPGEPRGPKPCRCEAGLPSIGTYLLVE